MNKLNFRTYFFYILFQILRPNLNISKYEAVIYHANLKQLKNQGIPKTICLLNNTNKSKLWFTFCSVMVENKLSWHLLVQNQQ